ncbi:MFS transporter [Kerstersia gyiorum]|uniref:MFS transporter n=1 Tax=Kerstersia gyiorum TaxID=206506 RepID=UPI0021504D28|nr:MFS transporter [Kerstersia gyiorum]MCR4158368.1 MFS transporter [Kerstersia gyiorum]
MKHPTITLLLLMTGAVLVVGQLYVTIPLAADLAQHWQVSAAQASWAGSAFGFAYAAGFLLLGRLSDRLGRRRVLLAGLLATAAASVLVACATNFAMLLGTRAVQGLLAATFPPAALALVAEALPPARRPLGISLLSFAFLASAPLTQFLATQSAGFGLPIMMAALAVAYVMLAAGLSQTLPPPSAPASEPVLAPMQTASQALPPALLGVWLAATTVLFGFVTFHAGAQAMGLEAAVLQSLRLAGLPPLLLSIAAAGLVRRIGTLATARMGLILAATGLLAGWSGLFGELMVASVLLSAGIALAVPGLIGTLASRSSPETRARAMSRYTFALFMGASVAPPIAAVLAAQGWPVLLLVPAAALIGAAVIVGGWPTARIPHPKENR